MVQAWTRPGRMLGYVANRRWITFGLNLEPQQAVTITIGEDIAPGVMKLQWWSADEGVVVKEEEFLHTGGKLNIHAPEFSRHLAFKLWRE